MRKEFKKKKKKKKMNKTKSGNNNRPRRSVSFLTRLRPDNLVPNKRPQQQQQGDPLEW